MNVHKIIAVVALLSDACVYLFYGHPIIAAAWIGAAAVTTWILPAR